MKITLIVSIALLAVFFIACPQPQKTDTLELSGGYEIVNISGNCLECSTDQRTMSAYIRADSLILDGVIVGATIISGRAGDTLSCAQLLGGDAELSTSGTLVGTYGSCTGETSLSGILTYDAEGNLFGSLVIIGVTGNINQGVGEIFFEGSKTGTYSGYIQSKGKKCSE